MKGGLCSLQNHAKEVNESSTKHCQLARPKLTPNVNAEVNGSFINCHQLARLKAMLQENKTSSIDSRFCMCQIDYEPTRVSAILVLPTLF